jgi:hypothetical protein
MVACQCNVYLLLKSEVMYQEESLMAVFFITINVWGSYSKTVNFLS